MKKEQEFPTDLSCWQQSPPEWVLSQLITAAPALLVLTPLAKPVSIPSSESPFYFLLCKRLAGFLRTLIPLQQPQTWPF